MAMRKFMFYFLLVLGFTSIGITIWWVVGNISQSAPSVAGQHTSLERRPQVTVIQHTPVRASQSSERFNSQRAFQDLLAQVAFGPRIPGSEAHAQTITWMQGELEKAGWQVEIQKSELLNHPIQNLIAYRGDALPKIILGAHFDSRLVADRDLGAGGNEPVPGANDGASGVAVLLELARTLPSYTIPIWMVFFDAEDNSNLPGWEGLLGSRAFVTSLTSRPRAVVIVDMIGDSDLNIFIEKNSDAQLTKAIWSQAITLGYEKQFISSPKYSIIDDHTPFLQAGIPAVDIIDFDYPYWHTSADTTDKVSAESLQIVGRTLEAWILTQR